MAQTPVNQPSGVDSALLKALQGEDELGVVVRSHIHIEAGLSALLEALTPFPKELPHLRFEQRARLAIALGAHPDMFKPLKVLGDIRNSFGHRLDTKLTDSIVQDWFDAFGTDHRNVIIGAYLTTKHYRGPDMPEDFSKLNPKDRFTVIAIALDSILRLQTREAAKRAPRNAELSGG